MNSVMHFKEVYELRRKMYKEEIDNLLEIIDETKNIDLNLEIDNEVSTL